MWKSDRTPPPPGTDLCAANDVADGVARVVPYGGGGNGKELIVVREGDNVYGYINECAHNTVPLNLLDDFGVQATKYRMHCDHHYASFRFADGFCTEGPCEGESLTAVRLAVRGGRVVVAYPAKA
jgi:nitrite reductase/ring-hydroxylating ferredoxin subunit